MLQLVLKIGKNKERQRWNSNRSTITHSRCAMNNIHIKPTRKSFQDLEGKKFNRLLVKQYLGKRKTEQLWLCYCECGKETIANSCSIKGGHTKSCGCLMKEVSKRIGINNRKHGAWAKDKTNFPEWSSWQKMKSRCYNPNNNRYGHYGKRGIKVCERWLNSFENFVADMGKRPSEKHSLDRIDVNGNYEPNNCRWADDDTQANNKRTNIVIGYKGVSKTATQWAKEYNMGLYTLLNRVRNGWDIDRALNQPVQGKTDPQDLAKWKRLVK